MLPGAAARPRRDASTEARMIRCSATSAAVELDPLHRRAHHRAASSARASTASPTSSTTRTTPFLVLEDVTIDEFGHRGEPITRRVRPGQPRRGAVRGRRRRRSSDRPSCGRPKIAERGADLDPAVQGRRQHPPAAAERDLREALVELTGRFLPVTDATYWSDPLGEARQTGAAGRGQPQRAPRSWRRTRRSTRGPGSTARGERRPSRRRAADPSRRPSPPPVRRPSGWPGSDRR